MKRTKDQIIKDALYMIYLNPGIRFTKFKQRCNMNYKPAKELLDELMDKNLVRLKCQATTSPRYVLTSEGIDALLELLNTEKYKKGIEQVFNELIGVWQEINKKHKDGNKAFAEIGRYIRKRC